ncbi:hypothetical protein SAMN05216360_12422 [Methylobacterium phyllostachyos]|uniref:BON domain-containing protein n=1 Tax=Methylobacterium phyllostachyos TaxID=582672 RepID=A0A1H0JYT0_9HYPH|nr:BON domain-containing protein [Methylobacterium phyllostachyos]SDO48827.1 hypothetical protein SAMN05216360_12422 [Methylobacterium phyllostachyos]
MSDSFARGLRRAGWLAGLPALALIGVSATLYAAPQIAGRLEAEAADVAAGTATETGEPWLRLEARGRDLMVDGEAPDAEARAAVLSRLAALDGPRRIVSGIGLVETATPFRWAAIRVGPGRVALEGSRPAEIGRRALEARVTGALAPGTSLDDTARAARGAPPDFPSAAAFLAARLSGLAAGGRAALSDTVLNLSGEAVDVPAYEALRAVLSEPPAGFSIGRVEILPPRVAQYRFTVEKDAGGIVLDGFVPSAADREVARRAAQEAAQETASATVDDRLVTARGLDPAIDPKTLIAFAFRLAALIQTGRVTFADGAVSISGDAMDGQAMPDAEALMREARPAGVAAGRISLTARPLSPYRVAIRRTPEAVTLTGHVPDVATRERVLDALRPRLFREPILDRTRLADGAPPDLGAALAAAAPLVAGLATGEASVSDRTLTLTGESLYREVAARAPDRLAEALPPGWTGQAAVSARQPAERRDPATCRADFAAVTAGADLRFPAGSAVPGPAFYPTLDALAALAKACPSLRIAVSGPADPAKAAPTPAAGPGEGAHPAAPSEAEATRVASAAKAEATGKPDAKASGKHDKAEAKADPKDAAKKDAPKRGKPAPKKPEAAAEEPPQDLPRLRTQAVVEYLLQAGARPDQVSTGPDAPAGPVTFALLP